jgi:hypothetical protein
VASTTRAGQALALFLSVFVVYMNTVTVLK